MKKPNFDIYEAAILHSECMKIRELGKNRIEAITCVSNKLRKRAVNAGLDIPENFRNYHGIESQMRYMDSAVDHTVPAGHDTPKLFIQIVEIYASDRKEYDRILNIALQSCCNKPDNQ